MKNLPKFYLDYIQKNFGIYHGTWLPSYNLSLGDIISIGDDGGILRQSTLERQGISFEIREGESPFNTDNEMNADVDITPALQASTPAIGNVITYAEVGFDVHFNRDNSVVFKLSGPRLYSIDFLAELAPVILEKYREGSWQKEWMIVTELIKADSGTIIIAASAGTSISLRLQASVNAGPIEITNPLLTFDSSANTEITGTYIMSNITPLYRCMGIKTSLFGTGFNTRALSDDEMKTLVLTEVDPYNRSNSVDH